MFQGIFTNTGRDYPKRVIIHTHGVGGVLHTITVLKNIALTCHHVATLLIVM